MAGVVKTVSKTTTGPSGAIEINLPSVGPWMGVGLLVTFSAGASAAANVEVSGDGTHWNSHDVLNGLTGSANSNITDPMMWVRLNVTSHTSGTITLTAVQALPV